MATWEEIGLDNLAAGRELYRSGRYRSSVSRFYYAAFHVVTHALEGKFDTDSGQETPSHKGLPKAIRLQLTNFSEQQRADIVRIIRCLYDVRIDADYRRRTTDKATAMNALRDALRLFEFLGVEINGGGSDSRAD